MTATLVAPTSAGRYAVSPTLVIEAGRLFDGRDVWDDVRIVIADDTIVAVEPLAQPAPDGAAGACRVLSFPDSTVLPGLIDAHMHLSLLARASLKAKHAPEVSTSQRSGAVGNGAAGASGKGRRTSGTSGTSGARNASAEALVDEAVQVADAYLARGVTTLRDLGDRLRLNLQVRQRLSARVRPGPRLLAPGRALHREGLYGSFIGAAAAGLDQLLALADEELEAGVDFVKVVASGIIDFNEATVSAPVPFAATELRALVDRVHGRGKLVAAHASGAAGVAAAVAGGVDFVEHGFFAESGPGGPVDAFMNGVCIWVPTFIPVDVVASGKALTELTEGERAGVRGIVVRHAATLRAVHAAGGAVIAGSDAGSPGVWDSGGVVGELRCFQRAGLALRDALAAATSRAAAALGIGHLTGSVTAGKRADLLVVDGNPLESLDALDDVRSVIRDGKIAVVDDRL